MKKRHLFLHKETLVGLSSINLREIDGAIVHTVDICTLFHPCQHCVEPDCGDGQLTANIPCNSGNPTLCCETIGCPTNVC